MPHRPRVVRAPEARFRDGERVRTEVEQGDGDVGGQGEAREVVAGADADVEVGWGDVGAEEGEEGAGCRAAPGVGGDDAEDPPVVDGEEEGAVD